MKRVLLMIIALMLACAAGCGTKPSRPELPTNIADIPVASAAPTVDETLIEPSAEPSAEAPAESPVEASEPTAYYILGDGVRVRTQGSETADVICTLPAGTPVQRISEQGEWIQVQYDEISGFVHADFVTDMKPQVPLMAPRSLSNPKIVVKKAARILELWDGSALVARFPVGLGWTPEGHKVKEGDGKTPEGDYYVCVRNDHSSFYLSLGVSYPNKQDAKAGFESGLIDEAQYERIATAIDRGERPSWSTPLGGEIMIHGHGGNRDWTAGCVAVDDEVMDILWQACPMGTPIQIRP